MAKFTAFFDACVMVPIAPSDTYLRMAELGAFRPTWSQKVIEEAVSALIRIHPGENPSLFQSRFRAMNTAFDDAMVTGWEPLVAGLALPDDGDRHVLAAAIRSRADVIVTENTKHFPDHALKPFDIKAVRLDDFLLDQLDLNPAAAVSVVREQARDMSRPPVKLEHLLDRLARSGARRFAEAVREHADME
ncbi:PIN domain-containing protein [Leucobacter sp. NPDC077196]|uniref:PIN domain-containing protein n=1 Tax=Leucobacter sp. NPDC077196 TaxID=3154959 RepID=UPI003412BFDE